MMKNLLRRNLLFITIFAIITTCCFSSPFNFIRDTTLLGSNRLGTNIVSYPNVNYPKLLEGQKAQSINYVEKYSQKNHDFLEELYNKGKNFFPAISSVFTKYGLPTELKVLIAIESGFKSNAVSKAGAVGYWQMMDEMAIDYGLKIGKADERKNLKKSTTAAAKFLKNQCNDFDNDILLAVAAYNCGGGNVRKAMRKSGVENASFWDIKKYLPKETRLYVMNFITLNVIFDNYDKFTNNQLVFKPIAINTTVTPVPAPLVN